MMQHLEDKGLIYRLYPGHHDLDVPAGETGVRSIYECQEKFGPHKLIVVTVNRPGLPGFGSHPDVEDFILIGDPAPDTKPLYLVIALCCQAELEQKINGQSLTDEDFITLRVKYNDPEVSFFSMAKDVPHGEGVAHCPGKAASFYVTEPRDLPLQLTNLGYYRFAGI